MKKLIFTAVSLLLTIALLLSFPSVFADDEAHVHRKVIGDFTGDGSVTSDDAIYLLRYTLFPGKFPLCDHTDTYWEISKDATDTEEGEKILVCRNCGEILETRVMPVLAAPEGKSAYELAVGEGFVGSVTEWLDSLKGDKGDAGEKGEAGNGVESIELTSSEGLIDTYTITFTDGSTTEFTVTNGEKGDKGDPGDKGDAGVSIINAYIDDSMHLILIMSNDSTIDAGYVGVPTDIKPVQNEYNVIFKDWDGMILKDETVTEGESATAPNAPTRTGYIFTGWSGTYVNVTADLVIIATYELNITTPAFVVETKQCKAGDSVEITISIKNNPGVAGAILTIVSDPKLVLVGAVSGPAFSGLTYTRPGRFTNSCNFSWDSESGMATGDGVILTLNYTVSENVSIQDILNIICTYKTGDIYDENLNNVSFDVVNGALQVIE